MKRLLGMIACVAFSIAMIGCGRNTGAEYPSATMKADPNATMGVAPPPPKLKLPGDP